MAGSNMSSDYEEFQQKMFDQLDDLEQADQQRVLVEFVKVGYRCGIDVVNEIKQGKPVDEVVERVLEKRKELRI